MPLPHVEPALRSIASGRSRFLFGIDRVPEERLSWSPGADAPTPLALAAKLVRFLEVIDHVLTHRAMPERRETTPPPPASREEAKATVDAAFGRLRETLMALTEADLAVVVPLPRRTMTIAELLWGIPAIIGYHQGQMNLIQLCYGDKDPNVPPNWGQEEI